MCKLFTALLGFIVAFMSVMIGVMVYSDGTIEWYGLKFWYINTILVLALITGCGLMAQSRRVEG